MTNSKDLIATAYSAEEPCKWCAGTPYETLNPHNFLSAVGNHCLWCGTREAHTWDECRERLLSAGK